ncbi:hypothetical protein IWQ61_001741 [Dispira simplex]|nr:hypothetical protein IWQ61_001741 [Dispira simplex]
MTELRIWAQYAFAAYQDVTDWSCERCQGHTANTQFVGVYENIFPAMRWYLAVHKGRKTIILGCRGSTEKNFLTFLTNAVVSKKNWPPAASDSKVHKGFLDSTQVGMGKVRDALKLLVGEYPDFTITLTGHSLGGAQAVLAAVQIAMDNSQWKSKLRVYTFGEPRVGNTEFAQYYDTQGIPTRRVVNHNDLVPHLPPHAMGFTHHGGEVWIRSSDNQGVVCPSVYPDENADCSSGVQFYKRTLNDHSTYWDSYKFNRMLLSGELQQSI